MQYISPCHGAILPKLPKIHRIGPDFSRYHGCQVVVEHQNRWISTFLASVIPKPSTRKGFYVHKDIKYDPNCSKSMFSSTDFRRWRDWVWTFTEAIWFWISDTISYFPSRNWTGFSGWIRWIATTRRNTILFGYEFSIWIALEVSHLEDPVMIIPSLDWSERTVIVLSSYSGKLLLLTLSAKRAPNTIETGWSQRWRRFCLS